MMLSVSMGSVVFLCRGNSKYHYYGIRIKPDSPLNNFQMESIVEARRQQPAQKRCAE